MKQFVRLFGACILALAASAQQRGVMVGLPPVGPIPPLGGQAITLPHPQPSDHRFGFPRRGGSFPFGIPIYSGGYYPQQPSAPPSVIVLQAPAPAPAPPVVREPTPAEVKPEIHEYTKAAWAEAAPPEGEQPAFAVVLKNGTELSAIAVWSAGDNLNYVAPDGTHGQAALSSIDRNETRRRNQERKLYLPVPAPLGK